MFVPRVGKLVIVKLLSIHQLQSFNPQPYN